MTKSINLADDLGFPGLGIDLEGNVTATLKVWYDFVIQFGAVRDSGGNYGFYLNTAAANPELALHAAVIVAPGSSVSGAVGLLRFTATSGADTSLRIDYAADLFDADGKLSRAEISSGGLDFRSTATIDAAAMLNMSAEFGGSAINPMVNADFILDWMVTGNPEVDSLTQFNASAPSVSFNNIRWTLRKASSRGSPSRWFATSAKSPALSSRSSPP